MENKSYTPIQNHMSIANRSSISDTGITGSSNSFVLSPIVHKTTVTTTTSPINLQAIPVTRSSQVYSDNTNHNNGSSRVITQPTFKKLSGESLIKQEKIEDTSTVEHNTTSRSKIINTISKSHPTVINSISINPRETLNGLSAISMTNVGAHIITSLNPAHLTDGTAPYLISNLSNSITPSYKTLPSSNSDLPSPSNSSNSPNNSTSNHHHDIHQGKRHGEGNDPGRKREVRLQKNREAARECRRKKKEYIKCLEERVTSLETQNKALIEELRQLKELYCQREETNNTTTNKTATTIR